MDTSWINVLYKPTLRNPIFVQGLSTSDQASSAVTKLLLKHTNSKKFAEFYSPYFPDYILSKGNGLCNLLRYKLYTNDQFEPNIVLLIGNAQFLSDDAYANYEVFAKIFNYAKKIGCKRFISYMVFKPDQVEDTIYIAATSGKLASKVTKVFGGKVLSQGRISGAIGLILGLSHSQGFKGLCILKPLISDVPSEVTTLSLFNYILKILESKKE